MKNKNDAKFDKQVNHLQSFIGMPMRNYRQSSLEEIREHDRRVIKQQKKSFEPKKRNLLIRIFCKLSIKLIAKLIATDSSITNADINKQEKKEPIISGSKCCG